MRRVRTVSMRTLLVFAVAAAVFAPALAYAVTTPGGASGFGNSFAQVGGSASDPTQNVCTCHIATVLAYANTPHGSDMTIANGDPARIHPTMPGYWPTPTYGNSLRFTPPDIGWVMGAYSGTMPPAGGMARDHDYILRPGLWGPKGSTVTVSTGATFAAGAPIDDVGLVTGLAFDRNATSTTNPQGLWVNEASVAVVPYFQRCGGCHALGLTRPSNATSTVGNGAQITPSTPTSYAAMGIHCENCHGSGESTPTHGFTLPGVVGAIGGTVPKRALSSDVCGQCHVGGYTSETRVGSTTSGFSNPNGYTPDMTLAAFNITSAAQGAYASYTVRRLSMETTTNGRATKYFYPTGHNKGLYHAAYNEWLESGHAKSRKTILVDMAFLPNFVKATCLKCHTAEGYLASKVYQSGPFRLTMTSSPSTDRMNVECPVCHAVHDAAAGPGGQGLRVDRDAICQECHTADVPEGGEATPGEEIHNPEKELLAGYGLIDVPTTTAYMPGVACPDCHMPVTFGSRKSHRFTAMLPGDAEDWGVREGGDSCSPCHPTRSRAALQAYIDGWEADVAAAADAAEAAIDDAKTRPASTTPTGISLINRATTNWTFTNDPGAAVHNYPYMLAGMRKARSMARAVGGTLAFESASSSVARGARAYLRGTARFGDGGAAAGETVVIEKKAAGETAFTTLATLVCDSDGDFAYAPAQMTNTDYRAYWRASGADVVWATGTVSVGIRTTISLSAPTSVRRYTRFTVKGNVSPRQTGWVKVYIKAPWTRGWAVTTRRLSTAGYWLSYTPSRPGRYYFYARFAGNANVLPSSSRVARVTVR